MAAGIAYFDCLHGTVRSVLNLSIPTSYWWTGALWQTFHDTIYVKLHGSKQNHCDLPVPHTPLLHWEIFLCDLLLGRFALPVENLYNIIINEYWIMIWKIYSRKFVHCSKFMKPYRTKPLTITTKSYFYWKVTQIQNKVHEKTNSKVWVWHTWVGICTGNHKVSRTSVFLNNQILSLSFEPVGRAKSGHFERRAGLN